MTIETLEVISTCLFIIAFGTGSVAIGIVIGDYRKAVKELKSLKDER